jgi:hypothetical protein
MINPATFVGMQNPRFGAIHQFRLPTLYAPIVDIRMKLGNMAVIREDHHQEARVTRGEQDIPDDEASGEVTEDLEDAGPPLGQKLVTPDTRPGTSTQRPVPPPPRKGA